MKKKLITGIITTVLGIVISVPVVGQAETTDTYSLRADANSDGVVDVSDYILVRKAINVNGSIRDGVVYPYVSGDLNDDGTVNYFDVLLVKNYLMGETAYISKDAADVNGDGEINVQDYTLIRKCANVHGQIQGNKILPYVVGDINNDSFLNAEDLEAYKQVI